MALITGLRILNGSDKTRHYTVCIGTGAPAETTDPLVSDGKKYPVGSTYINEANGVMYTRKAATGAVNNWVAQGTGSLFTAPLANVADFAALKVAMIAAGLMAAS